MLAKKQEKRPKSVEEILNDPLFHDIKNLTNEDYMEYEKMMINLEKEINKDNEIIENNHKIEDNNNKMEV